MNDEKHQDKDNSYLLKDHVENWVLVDNIFTPDQCQKIIEIGESLLVNEASVANKTLDANIKKYRNSFVSSITPNAEHFWIFDRLSKAVGYLNSKCFQFDIESFNEDLQFTRYHAPDGHYSRHIDKALMGPLRKLSLSIQLNDSSEFDGGDLLLHTEPEPIKPEMKQGKMLLFPSYVLHEVTPVTRGTRYSLVAWISGPPFK